MNFDLTSIVSADPDFSEDKFKTFVDNVFVQIHMAIMTKELERVKHFMSAEVYASFEQRVKELNQRNLTQMYDEFNVKETHLLNSSVVNGTMRIEVLIVSRYMDYRMDENGNIVDGVSDHRITKNNRLIFQKQVQHEEQGMVRKCPGCGASINVNGNGKCEYCGTIYNLADKDWLLVSIVTEA